MPEPSQSEMIQELYRRRSELDPQEGAMVDELMKRMTASGEIRGAEPGQQRLPPGLTGVPEAPREQPQLGSAAGRLISGFIEPVTGVIGAAREYFDKPSQWRTVGNVLRTRPGSPEEQAAFEQAESAPPLENPMAYVPPQMGGPTLSALGKLGQGDVAGAIGTAAGFYGVPAAVGYGTSKVISPEARARGGQMVRRGVEELETAVMGQRPTTTLINQALRPINRNIKFDQDVDIAVPEINASAEALGKPITNIHDMLDAVNDAKKRVWAQRDIAAPGLGQRQINLKPVADAMERTITKRMELQDPARAASIREKANTYRNRTFTMQEAENFLREANAELKTYYAKNPLMQRVERTSNPETAALVSEGQVLRDRVFGELDQAGQGAGPRELSRRYGALLNMEGEIYRRMKVADRQAQMSLAEQLATASGLAEATIGVATGHPMMAATGLLRKQLATEMKEAMQTDRLIERAFRNDKRRPVPVRWQPTEPRALLGPGAIRTPPPPDPSGITVTTGPPLQPRVRGALPPAPLVTPPPADLSGIEIVDAARGIARDPKTGRMFRYYTSERK